MESLFSLGDRYLQLLEQISENDGVVEDETLKELEDLENAIIQKSDNYILVSDSFDMKIERLKEWSKRISNAIKFLEHKKDRLHKRLLDFMINNQMFELEGEIGKIKIKESKKVSSDINFELLPDEYKKTEIIISPKKSEIRKALLDGEEVPGASLETSKYVRIFKPRLK